MRLFSGPLSACLSCGVSVVVCNKIGPMHSSNPWSWFVIPTEHTFRGFSNIGSSDVTVIRRAINENLHGDIIMADIIVDPSKKHTRGQIQAQLDRHGRDRYLVSLPQPLPFMWTCITEPMGRLSYALSYQKRLRAAHRAIERGSKPSGYKHTQKSFSVSTVWITAATVMGAAMVWMSITKTKIGKF